MAMIDCPECKKAISDSSRKCPHCDYALRSDTAMESAVKTTGEVLNTLVTIAVLVGMSFAAIHFNDWVTWGFCIFCWVGYFASLLNEHISKTEQKPEQTSPQSETVRNE